MSISTIFRNRVIFTVLLSLVVSIPVLAQDEPSQDPTNNPRNVRREEMNRVYKRWLDEDVRYIITGDERKAFMALQTDDERENFIELFWRRRDPNPDTEENEFREEYYERIAYANEKFTSGIPGWRTDRGRIYISWGKPDSVESRPAGGSYERPMYEGGGSTSTYPFETWFYRHLEGVGSGVEIEFVDPTGTGEYRIARNANEKDAMLYIPGAGMTLLEQMGLENRADRISGINSHNSSYMRQQDMPFERLAQLVALDRPPPVKFGDLAEIAGGSSGIYDKNPLDFDVRIDYFRQSDEQVMVAFTIQTDNSELRFEDAGGLNTARMNIFGRITSVSDRRAGIFEDTVTTNATREELANMQHRKSVYQKTMAMKPGVYKVDVVVRDVETGNRGIRNIGFTVPRYDSRKLSTSSIILASRLRQTDERDIGGMFIIGGAKVIPNLERVYRRGDEIGVFMQVYNAGTDQTTLRPSVDVEYVLTKGNAELMRQKEDWTGLSDSSQRLTLARLIPSINLERGDYEAKIIVKDQVTGQLIEAKDKFTIVD